MCASGASSAKNSTLLATSAADLRGAEFTGVRRPQGSPVLQLFTPEERRGTLLLWATFFMSLLVFYLLASWLPTVINSAGMSMQQASYFAMMLQLGGTVPPTSWSGSKVDASIHTGTPTAQLAGITLR